MPPLSSKGTAAKRLRHVFTSAKAWAHCASGARVAGHLALDANGHIDAVNCLAVGGIDEAHRQAPCALPVVSDVYASRSMANSSSCFSVTSPGHMEAANQR